MNHTRNLLYLILVTASTTGVSSAGTFFRKIVINTTQFPLKRHVIEEDSAFSAMTLCGLKCSQDVNCMGFGFRYLPNRKCLTVMGHMVDSSISVQVTNFTYYESETKKTRTTGGTQATVVARPDGDWLVIQRRIDGSVDFYRNWAEYKAGFGDLSGEYWLGNENLHNLTKDGNYKLRIELTDLNGTDTAAVTYASFSVGNESSNYALALGPSDGSKPPGNDFYYHNGMGFSTYDRDNDRASENCAVEYKGGWWYKSCSRANLNGLYGHKSFTYASWEGSTGLSAVTMMVKRT